MSSGALVKAAAFVRARIAADFAVPGMAAIEPRTDWSFAEEGVPGSEVVVVVGGHRFPAHVEDGVESACARVADALQDDVVDLLARPWPEVVLGPQQGVLEGALEPVGLAHWHLRGQPVCAVGHLRPLFDRYELPWP